MHDDPVIDTSSVFNLGLSALHARQDFVPLRPGVEIAKLYEDPRTGASAAVLRYAPGARVPAHTHQGYEHILILEGEQCDARGCYQTGSLVINPPGSGHEVWSPAGCLALLIWERPVRFDAGTAL